MECEKPVAEYYKHKGIICHNQSGYQNNQVLNRLERDLCALMSDIKAMKDDISVIREYIRIKKQKEDKSWF